MDMLFGILAAVCGLGSFVFGIVVLYRMYQKAGIVQAILGFICSIWAFIWGWMNLREDKFMNMPTMITLTGFIVGQVIFQVLAGMFAGGSGG